MSKAEEKAQTVYPAWRNGVGDVFSQNSAYYGFIEGYHQAEKDLELTIDDIKDIDSLWKDANGDVLPEIGREVIALVGLDEKGDYRVVFAHRVDPDRVIRTTIDNKPLELHPNKYGKAGWNLPNLKYWLDLELPKTK